MEGRRVSKVTEETVRRVNGLTARWAHALPGEGTVFSAPGVWPLLAFLADGAAGPARAELAGALGVPAERAAGAARELLAHLASVSGLDAALGLWTYHALALREEWRAGLPAGTHGVFGDDLVTAQERLDAWAAERTGGLVERMPVTLTRDARMVLAGALALRTQWRQPFTERPLRPDAGPWQGRTPARSAPAQCAARPGGVAGTPDGFVTALTVPGDNGVDVHLVLGEERMTPGQVLAAGVGVVERGLPLTAGGGVAARARGPRSACGAAAGHRAGTEDAGRDDGGVRGAGPTTTCSRPRACSVSPRRRTPTRATSRG